MVEGHHPNELPQRPDCEGAWEGSDHFHLRGEGGSPLTCDAVSEEVDGVQPEQTLRPVDDQAVRAEPRKEGPEMRQVLPLGGASDENVIQVDKDEGEVPKHRVLTNVEQFNAINALPTKLYFGDGQTASNFASHSASWHKYCHLKFNNFKLAKAKEKRQHNPRNPDDSEGKKQMKRQRLDIQKCFFCESGTDQGVLHEVSTFDADKKIQTMITELDDTKFMTRIVGGDLMAMEAKYHLPCLVKSRNRHRSLTRKSGQSPENTDEKMNESRAFIELINYIEKSVDSGVLLFKLSEIHSLYVSRLGELGIKKLVNKTRLKDHLLEHLPEARAQCDGKNTLLIFKEGLKNMLKEALNKRNFDEDALILAKAAKIIRNDIINHSGFQFTGSFPEKCQENALPSSLKSLVSMVLNGSNIKHQEKCDSQACLTIGQCIVYHTKKRASSTAMKTRHTLEREPPLPIYIGINVHAQTRSKKLVQQLHNLGISISYDRIMQIEDWLATSTCEGFEADGVVAPACLRKGLFTVGALDNLDHNPSSTTSVTSFHGTGISLFQLPTKSEPEGSGWTTALTEADVASSGMAESFLKAAHLTRTRHAHQVTLLTLHNLQQEAFRLSAGPKDEEYLMAWRNEMLKKSPTFMFWDLIMRYETLILIFIRAHRERNFPLYVEVLEVLAPLFFALDHVNYSRWMPVHIRDMKSLPNTIKDEFENN
ncbi:hypothetical protein SKAU_G00245030 [Synaphobranchus kaupii]|uniref:Uncharacterized protein n=1 Tax=Synaphobranchus kaupii TaxID=118154 RepID=A0A9Q1IR38_SYNKA|nr:hypothetical protein SKAU_G00245030 [Synaphobranchus kaupii]